MYNNFLKYLIMENVCHYLPGDMRSIMKKVTNGDIGGGGRGRGRGKGVKGDIFVVTSFLNGP